MTGESNPDKLDDLRFSDGSLISPALDEGIRLFNQGDFFECHEVLEDAWREEHGPLKDLYQGLIKAAVAFYHALNDNLEGAVKVMESGLKQLRPYRQWAGIQMDRLIPQLDLCLKEFLELESTQSLFPHEHIPNIVKRA